MKVSQDLVVSSLHLHPIMVACCYGRNILSVHHLAKSDNLFGEGSFIRETRDFEFLSICKLNTPRTRELRVVE